MTTNRTINPAWLAYNNLYNEGGEGYNPHNKYIGLHKAPVGWTRETTIRCRAAWNAWLKTLPEGAMLGSKDTAVGYKVAGFPAGSGFGDLKKAIAYYGL